MKITKEDTKKIENRIKVIHRTVFKFMSIYFFIAVLGFFIPLAFLPKAGGRFRGKISKPFPEQIGEVNYILIMLAIVIVITACILYLYNYFGLKKDLKEQTKIAFKATLQKIIVYTNDFGEETYKAWLSPNKHGLKKVEIKSDIIPESSLAIGAEAEIKVSTHAKLPLEVNISGNTPTVSKSDIDRILKKLSN